MARQCERPGCARDAAVAYTMDVGQLVVVFERLERALGQVGVLCQAHATAMRLPNGWTLDDRRTDTPALFAIGQNGEHRPRRRRAAAAAAADPSEQLALRLEAHAAPAERGGADINGIADIADIADIAEVAGVSTAATGDGLPAEQVPAEPEATPGHTAVENPSDQTMAWEWSPQRIDQSDLDGLLRATSPLLARAFGRRPQG